MHPTHSQDSNGTVSFSEFLAFEKEFYFSVSEDQVVEVVFSADVRKYAIAAPADTGGYTDHCIRHSKPGAVYPPDLNCVSLEPVYFIYLNAL